MEEESLEYIQGVPKQKYALVWEMVILERVVIVETQAEHHPPGVSVLGTKKYLLDPLIVFV